MTTAFLPSAISAISSTARAPAGRRLHVVIVDEELPYPPTSGKRIRTLNLVLRLAPRHRLTYLCHRNADPREAEAAAAFLNDHGVETIVVDRAVPPKSGPLFYGRLAANLLSPLPYSVASHTSRSLRQAIAEYAANHRVDLWQCEWTPYAEALRDLRGARRLVVAHNVESLIWQRYHETEKNPLKRWYIGQQWRKFERFERWAYHEADCTVAVSAEDAARIRDQFGGRRVQVVDNGVDTSYFQPAVDAYQPDAPARDDASSLASASGACGAGRILFLGSLDWRPNLDAVGQLLEHVFPAVQAHEPAARLCLVGRNPPEWLRRQAAATPGVELHASVPDVRPYLAGCSVLAVPLRIGGGSRLKILEALACGVPVVSTRVGAEGLCLEPGRHLTVVDGIADLAPALVQCLREPEAAREQARCGRCIVTERYDWSVLADRLEQVWLSCCQPLATQ
jgi:glycosyltransferase involved in cell wall biosynthesis